MPTRSLKNHPLCTPPGAQADLKRRGAVRPLLSVLIWFAIATAHAESFEVLGRTIELTPPTNFCRLGSTAREAALLDLQTKSTAPAGVLTQFTVPCNELEDFRQGKIDSFSRWAQVLVLRRQGQLQLVRESREDFVRSTAGNVSSTPVDFADVNRQIRQHLSQSGMQIAMTGMQPLGIRDSAFFATVQMASEENGLKVPMVAVIAATVANRLPIVVQVYATARAPDEPLIEIASSYVQSVVTQN